MHVRGGVLTRGAVREQRPKRPALRTHLRRFGFLALRVGVGRLFRLFWGWLVAIWRWVFGRLDYARQWRGDGGGGGAAAPPIAA